MRLQSCRKKSKAKGPGKRGHELPITMSHTQVGNRMTSDLCEVRIWFLNCLSPTSVASAMPRDRRINHEWNESSGGSNLEIESSTPFSGMQVDEFHGRCAFPSIFIPSMRSWRSWRLCTLWIRIPRRANRTCRPSWKALR